MSWKRIKVLGESTTSPCPLLCVKQLLAGDPRSFEDWNPRLTHKRALTPGRARPRGAKKRTDAGYPAAVVSRCLGSVRQNGAFGDEQVGAREGAIWLSWSRGVCTKLPVPLECRCTSAGLKGIKMSRHYIRRETRSGTRRRRDARDNRGSKGNAER